MTFILIFIHFILKNQRVLVIIFKINSAAIEVVTNEKITISERAMHTNVKSITFFLKDRRFKIKPTIAYPMKHPAKLVIKSSVEGFPSVVKSCIASTNTENPRQIAASLIIFFFSKT